MDRPTTVLPMGACLIHGPLNPVARDRVRLAYPKYGTFPGVSTFGEMFQALDILLGKRDVPAEVRPLANIRANFVARPSAAGFDEVDAVLVEPSSPVDLEYRGSYLNRNTLARVVLNPVKATGPEAAKAAAHWLRRGLDGMDDTIRRASAEVLVKHLPTDSPDREFFADVLLETRASQADVLAGFKAIGSIIPRPVGVSLYTFQYFADGRALHWPQGFIESVVAATEELDLPTFNAADVVRQYGVKEALKDDLRHYRPEFNPVIAEALAKFVDCVAGRDEQPPVVRSATS